MLFASLSRLSSRAYSRRCERGESAVVGGSPRRSVRSRSAAAARHDGPPAQAASRPPAPRPIPRRSLLCCNCRTGIRLDTRNRTSSAILTGSCGTQKKHKKTNKQTRWSGRHLARRRTAPRTPPPHRTATNTPPRSDDHRSQLGTRVACAPPLREWRVCSSHLHRRRRSRRNSNTRGLARNCAEPHRSWR